MKEKLKSKKTQLIILAIFFVFFASFSIYHFLKLKKDIGVREILWDTQNNEVFLVKTDGTEETLDIKPANGDILFRSNDLLVHQYKKDNELKSTVYEIDNENSLRKVSDYDMLIFYFENTLNYIADNQEGYKIVANGKTYTGDTHCRNATYLNSKFVCIETDGKIFYANLQEETISEKQYLKDENDNFVFATSMTANNDNTLLYLITATKNEEPKNIIYVLDNIENFNNAEEKYIIEDMPSFITIQNERVVLNALNKSTMDEGIVRQYRHYVLRNGISKINDYRYTLLVVF